jgi:uncharacterized protein (DUF1499 family)
MLKVQFLWLIMTLAAVLGFRASLLSWRPAMILVSAASGGLVVTGFFSLLVLFKLLRTGRWGGGTHCLLAVVLSLPALIGVLLLGVQGAKAPPINDISTDTDHPPVFRAAKTLRRAGDNSIDYPGKATADRQRQAYPDIKPIETPLLPTETFAQSLATAEKLRWRVIGQDREQGLIEAVDKTMLFGFTDDIIIRIAPTGNGSRIDLRSASRAGISDLGVNADRIRAFRRTFNSIQTKE